jgi:hypothetical protein
MDLIRRDNDNLIKLSSSGSDSLADVFSFDSCYRHFPFNAVITFWKTRCNSNTVPVGTALLIVS